MRKPDETRAQRAHQVAEIVGDPHRQLGRHGGTLGFQRPRLHRGDAAVGLHEIGDVPDQDQRTRLIVRGRSDARP